MFRQFRQSEEVEVDIRLDLNPQHQSFTVKVKSRLCKISSSLVLKRSQNNIVWLNTNMEPTRHRIGPKKDENHSKLSVRGEF